MKKIVDSFIFNSGKSIPCENLCNVDLTKKEQAEVREYLRIQNLAMSGGYITKDVFDGILSGRIDFDKKPSGSELIKHEGFENGMFSGKDPLEGVSETKLLHRVLEGNGEGTVTSNQF